MRNRRFNLHKNYIVEMLAELVKCEIVSDA